MAVCGLDGRLDVANSSPPLAGEHNAREDEDNEAFQVKREL